LSIREERTSLRQQRDELSSQLALAQQAAAESQQHSTGLETRLWETIEDLERARVELEQEHAQRQQLETSLQEMTANQAGQVVEPEPVETESREQWNATEAAPFAQRFRSMRIQEERTSLQQQRDELSSQLALAQQAAAEAQQHSTASEARLWEMTEELERARIELEQERAQRQQLETSLQELTANQAGQAVEPVETE